MRNENFIELKKEIISNFRDKDWDYACLDRLQVALHETLDSWVSYLTLSEVLDYLKNFDDEDVETLDRGLYEGVLEESGYEAFNRVLLYCLIEQDLYDEEDFNKLQFVKKVAGIILKWIRKKRRVIDQMNKKKVLAVYEGVERIAKKLSPSEGEATFKELYRKLYFLFGSTTVGIYDIKLLDTQIKLVKETEKLLQIIDKISLLCDEL